MPLYLFRVRNHDLEREDWTGVEPNDLETAWEQAVAGARRLMSAESLFQPTPSDRAAV